MNTRLYRLRTHDLAFAHIHRAHQKRSDRQMCSNEEEATTGIDIGNSLALIDLQFLNGLMGFR
jgi:hypothetical protein